MAAATSVPAVTFRAPPLAAVLAVLVTLALVAEQRVVRFVAAFGVAVAASQSGDALLNHPGDALVALVAALVAGMLFALVATALSLPPPTATVPALGLLVASVVRTAVAVSAPAATALVSAAISVLIAADSRTPRRTSVVRTSAAEPVRIVTFGSGEVVATAASLLVVPVEATFARVATTVALFAVASLVLPTAAPLLVTVGGVAVLVRVALVRGVAVSSLVVSVLSPSTFVASALSAPIFVATSAELGPGPVVALLALVHPVLVGVVASLAVSLWVGHNALLRANLPREFP